MNVSDLVEAVVLAGAEYFLDIALRRGGEGGRRRSRLSSELVAGEVGGVQVAGVGLAPGQRVRLQLLQELLLLLPGGPGGVHTAELLHHARALLQHLPAPLLLLLPRLALLLGALGPISLEEIGQRVLQNAVAGLFTLGPALCCQTFSLWGLGIFDVF